MRTKLHLFPSVSLSDVNNFEETMDRHARAFAHKQVQNPHEKRTEDKIVEDTMKGSRAKTAACLSNQRDPLEEVDWIFLGTFSDGYMYLGDHGSYVISVTLEDVQDDKIKISFPKSKYESKMLLSIERNKYSAYTEFVTYDPESELYFHLGRLATEKVKEPIDATKWNYIFEFDISSHREDGLLVLS